MYWRRVKPACLSIFKVLLLMAIIMASVTVYLHTSLLPTTSPLYADSLAIRDDALAWSVALASHLVVCVLLLSGFHVAACFYEPTLPTSSTQGGASVASAASRSSLFGFGSERGDYGSPAAHARAVREQRVSNCAKAAVREPPPQSRACPRYL